MSEQYTPQKQSSRNPENNSDIRLNKKGKVVVAAGLVGLGTVASFTADKVVDHVESLKPHSVHEEVIAVPQGETIISTAMDSVSSYLTDQGEDLSVKLPVEQIIREGQNAGGEYGDLYPGQAVQIGDQFNLTINLNEQGDYSVDISPVGTETNE